MAYLNGEEILFSPQVHITTPEVVQTTGDSETAVMSQMAVTEALATVGGGGGAWEKIVDITTTEEANGIVATVDEFPNIAKCKEFFIRVIFQKHGGTSNLQLGSSRVMINEILSCQITNTNVSYGVTSEFKAHIQLIDDLVHSVCTDSLVGLSALMGATRTNVGNRFVNEDVSNIKYYLSNGESLIPIGTQFVIYGKVES